MTKKSIHQGPKTVIVYLANAMNVEDSYEFLCKEFIESNREVFPKGTDVFMMDYPGTGDNYKKMPTLKNIKKCALELYNKGLQNAKEKNHTDLFVFTMSIGMGVFSSILEDIDTDGITLTIVCLHGLMSVRRTALHVSSIFYIFYPFLKGIFNTARNMAKFLKKKPDVYIYWFAAKDDHLINIDNVNHAISKWKNIDRDYYRDRIQLVTEGGSHMGFFSRSINFNVKKFHSSRGE